MKKRTTKDAFAQRLVRVGHVRAASRREGIGVLEGFCVSPNIYVLIFWVMGCIQINGAVCGNAATLSS